MKIASELRVYALGAIVSMALTICSWHFGDRGGSYFLVSLSMAGVAYLLAVREFFATPRFPRRVVVIGLVLSAVWQLQFLRIPTGPDDDIHRYVWDGRLQRLGYNPYVVVPEDPASGWLHTPETRTLNNPDVPTPYPPGAQLLFRALTSIHESAFAMKVAFVACGFAVAFLLLDVLGRNHQEAHLVLLYAWNPLLTIEVAGSGHVDIVGALLLLMSAAALGRRRQTTAAVALGLAIAVKLLPIVLLPLYWKRVRIRDAVLAAAVVGLLYVPFLDNGRIPIGSLATYVQRFRFNDPVFATLERAAPAQLVAGLSVCVGLAAATWLRHRSPKWSADLLAWPMAASLLCAPVVYPWYLLWLLPFLTTASTLPIIVWTVSIIPTYVVWHLRTLAQPWVVPGWVMLLEFGCLATASAIVMLRRLSSETTPVGILQEGRL